MPPELRGGGGAGETTCRGREKGVKRVETKERKKKNSGAEETGGKNRPASGKEENQGRLGNQGRKDRNGQRGWKDWVRLPVEEQRREARLE